MDGRGVGVIVLVGVGVNVFVGVGVWVAVLVGVGVADGTRVAEGVTVCVGADRNGTELQASERMSTRASTSASQLIPAGWLVFTPLAPSGFNEASF
jgi:hypothetical protein